MSEKKYFAIDFDNNVETFATEAEAKKCAEGSLEEARDMSGDGGWPENVTEISYGVLIASAVKTSHIDRPPDDEIDEDGQDRDGNYWADPDWSHIADYELRSK
jgi:hypothetical protein